MVSPSHVPLFWVVGAGPLQVPMIEAAQRLGFGVIVTDANPRAPGMALTPRAYPISTYDQVGHLALLTAMDPAVRSRIRGVATCGAEVAPTVAAIAEHLQLPGIPAEVAGRMRGKHQVRRTLAQQGLAQYQPRWTPATSAPFGIHEAARWVGYPVVVKPFHERASRGVTIVQDGTMLLPAWEKASHYGRHVLVEQCLSGTEHSVEILLDAHGQVCFFNVVDRLFTYTSGTPIEVGHINPSTLTAAQLATLRTLVEAAALALGVTWGPFKIDTIYTDAGPYILECTARLSGGWDCQKTTPLATGRDPIAALVQLAYGVEPWAGYLRPQWHRYAACAAVTLPPGRFVHFHTFASDHRYVQRNDDVLDFLEDYVLCVQPGDIIGPLDHNAQRPAFAFATGATRDDAWCKAQQQAAMVCQRCVFEDVDG